MFKRIGPLDAPQLPFYFACLLPFYFLNKTLNSYLSVFAAFPYPKSLINTFCSSLGSTSLFIEKLQLVPRLVGYQESFIGAVNREGNPTKPINFSAINELFWRRYRGGVALLVSEAGKETFILCCYFYFCYCCPQSLWTLLLLVRCW